MCIHFASKYDHIHNLKVHVTQVPLFCSLPSLVLEHEACYLWRTAGGTCSLKRLETCGFIGMLVLFCHQTLDSVLRYHTWKYIFQTLPIYSFIWNGEKVLPFPYISGLRNWGQILEPQNCFQPGPLENLAEKLATQAFVQIQAVKQTCNQKLNLKTVKPTCSHLICQYNSIFLTSRCYEQSIPTWGKCWWYIRNMLYAVFL